MKNQLDKIILGVSSCLLGEKVRFDSGHKKNQYLVNVLNDYFEFRPFCPEMAIGLGVPRESIRLVERNNNVICIGTKNTSLDVTKQLSDIADVQQEWHQKISGYILKKDSPSCGMERVRLYKTEIPERTGVGIYAKRLMANFPHLPIEEEGRLNDLPLRENFIQRVYIYARWQCLQKKPFTLAIIQQFHAQHKYICMSHDQLATKKLGALLANTLPAKNISEIADEYISQIMDLLQTVATKKNHTNTLQHIQGYLKRDISDDDKQELNFNIEQYRLGLLPLIVPITLLRHHFRKHPNDYITNTYYMCPHPGELMLLNSL